MHASPLFLCCSQFQEFLYSSLIYCAITSPATSSSKIPHSLFYLKHAMPVTGMPHRGCVCVWWKKSRWNLLLRIRGSWCDTRSLNICAAGWLREEKGRRIVFSRRGDVVKIYYKFWDANARQAEKTFKEMRGRWKIHGAGVTGGDGVLSFSHSSRCMFCCVLPVNPEQSASVSLLI